MDGADGNGLKLDFLSFNSLQSLSGTFKRSDGVVGKQEDGIVSTLQNSSLCGCSRVYF